MDASSGLYYDQASGYFFDPKTQTYLYYNKDQQCYMNYDKQLEGYVRYDPEKVLCVVASHASCCLHDPAHPSL